VRAGHHDPPPPPPPEKPPLPLKALPPESDPADATRSFAMVAKWCMAEQ